MTRICPCCGLRVVFYRMKGHLVWIYCSVCLHEMKVSREQASWYDEDDDKGNPD